MIKALIADDEYLARKNIAALLKDYPGIEIIQECKNGLETVQAIAGNKPDLVFLDIQMPEMDGMEVIRTLGVEHMPFVIFVTAYDKYAIDAFEIQAADYLLKPFTKKRFHEAVGRVLRGIEKQSEDSQSGQLTKILQSLSSHKPFVKRLAIQSSSRIYFLDTSEIDWIESAGNYIDIHTGGETHLMRETMKNIETKLNPEKFVRIHRSYIVNLDRVMEIQPDGNDYIVLLKNDKTLGMSRNYKSKLNDVIDTYF